MGTCTLCHATLLSTEEAAARRDLSSARVRDILDAHPERMGAGRVGYTWLVPADGVEEYTPQPNGVHLDSDGNGTWNPGACPQCGARLLSPALTAAELGVSASRVYAILAHHAEWLLAFRVGRRWLIPMAGVAAYRRRQDSRARVLRTLVGDAASKGGTVLVIVTGEGTTTTAGEGTRVKVVFGPEVCYCDNVKTKKRPGKQFPHRAGGGDCPYKPRVEKGMVLVEWDGPQKPELQKLEVVEHPTTDIAASPAPVVADG